MKKVLCALLCFLSAVYVSCGFAASAVKTDFYGATEEEEIYYDVPSENADGYGAKFSQEYKAVDDYKYRAYASVEENVFEDPIKAPTFIAYGLSSSCVVRAGGNALVFFDRKHDDLVPGFTWNGTDMYGPQNDAIDELFVTLYDYMGTSSSRGTTVEGFKKGMTKYVEERGFNLKLTSNAGRYYNTNFEDLKIRLRIRREVAVVFCSKFMLVSDWGFDRGAGLDKIQYTMYEDRHAMLVYGYRDIYYYDADGEQIARDTYLLVCTGFAGMMPRAMFCINESIIDDIYTIYVS